MGTASIGRLAVLLPHDPRGYRSKSKEETYDNFTAYSHFQIPKSELNSHHSSPNPAALTELDVVHPDYGERSLGN